MVNVRIVFSKTGRAKFISHLDLMRTMTRAVRRAQIPLWYTEGFNRHPYITFAAPLSLGYEGLHETMDLRLEEPMDLTELARRLDAVMPEGLSVLSAAECVYKAGQLAAARYRLTFNCTAEVMADLLAQPVIEVEKRTKKGGTKVIDLKPAVADAAVSPTETGCVVEVTLPGGSDNNVNPQLLLTALKQATDCESYTMQALRLELFAADGQAFR